MRLPLSPPVPLQWRTECQPPKEGMRECPAPGEPRQQGLLQIDLPRPPLSLTVSASLGAGEEKGSISTLCAPARHRCSLLINRQMLVLHLLSEGGLSPGPCMSGH